MNAQQLIAEVNELPLEDRALVVDSLLLSLNAASSNLDPEWLAVARRRLDEIQSGKVNAVAAENVFGHIWNRLGK